MMWIMKIVRIVKLQRRLTAIIFSTFFKIC